MLWVSYVPLTARLNAVLWHISFILSFFHLYLLKNFDITDISLLLHTYIHTYLLKQTEHTIVKMQR